MWLFEGADGGKWVQDIAQASLEVAGQDRARVLIESREAKKARLG